MNSKLLGNFYVVIIFSILAMYSTIGAANQKNAIQFNGFANIGATYSSNDELGFKNSLSNKGRRYFSLENESLLGLQVNVKLNEKLEMIGQVVLQDRNDMSLTNLIQLAFAKYQFNRNWSMNLGRVSGRGYLYADSRYVGQAMTWVRPQIEMYSAVGSVGTIDGFDIDYAKATNFGSYRLGFSFGNNNIRNDIDDQVFRLTYKNLYSFRAEAQMSNWLIRASYAHAELDGVVFTGSEEIKVIDKLLPALFTPYAIELQQAIIPDGGSVVYKSIGSVYTFDNYEFVVELGDYSSGWALTSGATFGYASLSYSIGEFIPFVNIGFVNRKKQPSVIDYEQAQTALPAKAFQQLLLITQSANEAVRTSAVEQKSLSVGVRWDFAFNWALKVQLDHFNIDGTGSGLFTLRQSEISPSNSLTYNVAAISLTTTF